MRRLAALAVVLLSSTATAQFAPQVWTSDQDGASNACYDVAYFQANNLAGGGTVCVEADNTGKLVPISCGAIGGVNSVTGTAAHISASPTTGAVVVDLIATSVTPGSYTYAAFTVDLDGRLTAASSGTAPVTSVTGTAQRISVTGGTTPVVDTIGGYYSGAVSGGNVNMGGLGSGVNEQAVSGGVASPSVYAATANYLQVGAASGGGLAQSASEQVISHALTLASSDGTGKAINMTQAGAYQEINKSGGILYIGTKDNFETDLYANNLTWVSVQPAGQVQFLGGDLLPTAIAAPAAPSAGTAHVYVDSTSKNLAVKNDAGTVNHGIQTASCGANTFASATTDAGALTCTQPSFSNLSGSATCAQMPALTGDVTTSAGTCGTTLTNIPNTTTAAGDIVFSNRAAPGPPAAGKNACYTDSTSKNWACINDTATVNHGIQTQSCGAHQWINLISDAGSTTCVQPVTGDINGWPAATQVLVSSGASTAPTGSAGLTFASSNLVVGNSVKVSGVAANSLLATDGSSFIAVAPAGLFPFDYVVTYGGANFIVDLPPLAFVGANPDFWLRPNTSFSTATGGPANFAAQGQVWEVDTGGTYGTVSLRAFVYQCAITTTAGTNDFTFTVTKNGTNTAVNVVASCPNAGTFNTDYTASGSVSFVATDRVGIRGTVTNTGSYSSGALRATVHVRLSP